MKRLSSCFFSILILFFASCDVGPLPRLPSWGYLTADMNGKEWSKTYKNAYQVTHAVEGKAAKYSAVPCQSDFTYIFSNLYNSDGNLRQELIFTKIPLERGHYKIIPFKNGTCNDSDPVYGIFYTSISDGDVAGDVYNVLNSEDNFIEIDDYKVSTKEIKGRFQITFIVESKRYGHYLPDTLRFLNGRFHTKIIDNEKRRRIL